jgi:hypothetical protein
MRLEAKNFHMGIDSFTRHRYYGHCGFLSCEHACRATPDGRGRCYCPLGFQINPANNRSCIVKKTIISFCKD